MSVMVTHFSRGPVLGVIARLTRRLGATVVLQEGVALDGWTTGRGSAGLADRATEHGHGRRRRSALRVVLRRTHPLLQEHHGCLEHADPYRNALHPCQHGGRLLRRGGGRGLRNEGCDAAPERAVSWWLSRICGHRRSLPHRARGSGQRLGASPVAGACDRAGSRPSGPPVGVIQKPRWPVLTGPARTRTRLRRCGSRSPARSAGHP